MPQLVRCPVEVPSALFPLHELSGAALAGSTLSKRQRHRSKIHVRVAEHDDGGVCPRIDTRLQQTGVRMSLTSRTSRTSHLSTVLAAHDISKANRIPAKY